MPMSCSPRTPSPTCAVTMASRSSRTRRSTTCAPHSRRSRRCLERSRRSGVRVGTPRDPAHRSQPSAAHGRRCGRHIATVNTCELIDSGEIWIDKLAVAANHRHGGIARALLWTAFRRSFERGYDHTSLSTDSLTGALTLYERIGMHVTRAFTNWAIDL